MTIMQAFPDALRAKLTAVGFSFHGDALCLQSDPNLRGKYWYCWRGPLNDWTEAESSDSFDSMEAAIVGAVDVLAQWAMDAVLLDEREKATTLAALRHWQDEWSTLDLPGQFADYFVGGTNDIEPLDTDEIDDLCERLA